MPRFRRLIQIILDIVSPHANRFGKPNVAPDKQASQQGQFTTGHKQPPHLKSIVSETQAPCNDLLLLLLCRVAPQTFSPSLSSSSSFSSSSSTLMPRARPKLTISMTPVSFPL